ncbi:MAG: aminotransferase class-V family protein [Caballeronia mineralivorans]|nr:aminotransferase class-V family protein [Caballeronia mineralivorans]
MHFETKFQIVPTPSTHFLLDPPTYPADRYAPLADRIKRLLVTASDVVFVQAEAILALEAAASSMARPGIVAINIVTSPYGVYFGAWLRRGGATVHDVISQPGQPVAMELVRGQADALDQIDIVAVVHGEAANGALNPLTDIASLARSRGALCVVDAVASIGGHALGMDSLGIDIVVIGAQKALGGPPGLSAVAISKRAWDHIAGIPALAPSCLSLANIKATWLDRGRGALRGTPAALEFWALEAAIDRVEAEGIENLITRHGLAATASRAGLRAMGIEPWIADDRAASALVTSAPVPPGMNVDDLIAHAARLGVALGRGVGDIENQLVRLNHTGVNATFNSVLAAVLAYGSAIRSLGAQADLGAAAKAVTSVYSAITC